METLLSCMYLMPDTQRATQNLDDFTMEEMWKGPWAEVKKALDPKNNSIFGVKLAPGMTRPTDLDGSTNWKAEHSAPRPSSLDEDVKWVIKEVEAIEIVAGDIGELRIKYNAVTQSSAGSGDVFADQRPTTWNLKWGQYNRSTLEYADQPDGSSHDTAAHILKCKTLPHPTRAELNANNLTEPAYDPAYTWWEGTDDIYRTVGFLVSDKAKAIYDYCSRDITPLFHYPIVERHQYIKQLPEPVVSSDPGQQARQKPKPLSAFERIDYKQSLPQDCPFTGLSGWQWLCVDDSYEGFYDGSFGYNRTTSWWGALSVDDNFYGADGTRWTPAPPPNMQGGN